MVHRVGRWTLVFRSFLTCGFSALVSLLGCGTTASPSQSSPQKPDAHCLPVAGDADGDLLSDVEERSLGRDPCDPDEDANLVRDGADLATAIAGWIGALPEGPVPGQPSRAYRVTQLMRGFVVCGTCGETVNMGYVRVVNGTTGEPVIVPMISLHYMSHGSFTAQTDPGYPERADVVALCTVFLGQ